MQSTKTENHGSGTHPEEEMELNVFLVHDDLASALRARREFDRMAGRLSFRAGFQVKLWCLTLSGAPGLRAGAARKARLSDIVLLSAEGGRGLPLRIYAWLEECLRSRDPLALAVSLDESAPACIEERPVVKRIRAIAKKFGADFFAHYEVVASAGRNRSPFLDEADACAPWIEDGTAAQW